MSLSTEAQEKTTVGNSEKGRAFRATWLTKPPHCKLCIKHEYQEAADTVNGARNDGVLSGKVVLLHALLYHNLRCFSAISSWSEATARIDTHCGAEMHHREGVWGRRLNAAAACGRSSPQGNQNKWKALASRADSPPGPKLMINLINYVQQRLVIDWLIIWSKKLEKVWKPWKKVHSMIFCSDIISIIPYSQSWFFLGGGQGGENGGHQQCQA